MDNLLDYFTGQVDVPDPQSNGDPRAQVLRDIVAKKQRRYAPQQDVYADQRIPGLGLGEGNPIDIANMSQSTRKSAVAAIPDIITTPGKVLGTLKDVGTAAVGKLSGDERPFVEQMGESQANAGPVRRYNQELSDTINESLGAPKDEDKSLPDQLAAGAFQSLVPVPAIPGGSSLITKGLSHAGNALVPGSSSLLGAAGNVGVGGAITAGVDALIHHEQDDKIASVPKGDLPQTVDEEVSTSVKSGLLGDSWQGPAVLSGLVLGVAFGKTAAVSKAAKAAAAAASDVSTTAFSRGGPQFVPAGSKSANKVSKMMDEFAPVQSMLQRGFEGMKDAEGSPVNAYQKGAAVINESTIDHRSNITHQFEDFITTGHIEGNDKPTIPLNVLSAQLDKLKQMGKLEAYQDWAYAKNAMDTRAAALTKREQRLQAIQVEQVTAVQKQQHTKYNTLDNERIKLEGEVQKLNADDPEMRGNMTGWGTLPTDKRNIKEIIAKGDPDPDFQETHKMGRTILNDLQEAEVKAGTITREKADSNNRLYPNYLPLIDDPHLGARGASRIWSKAEDRYWSSIENKLGEDPETVKRLSPTGKRNISTESPVNTPVSVHDAISIRADRAIRYMAHERFKRNIVDNLDAAAANKGEKVSPEFERFGGPDAPKVRSVEQVKVLAKEADISHYTSIMRNGKVELVKFEDPTVRAALEFAPQLSWPLLRSMKQGFTMTTTGQVFRPVFAASNFVYDNFTIQTVRSKDTRFGLDYLTEAALLKIGGGKMPDNLATFLRGSELVIGDPVNRLMAGGSAILSWGRQNQMMFARNIAEGLQKQQGFWHIMGQMTGGQERLLKLGQIAADSFNNSYYGMMSHQGVTSAEALQNAFSHSREVDSFFTKKLGPVLNAAISPLHGFAQQWRMVLSSVHSANRVSFVYQQLSIESLRRGVAISDLPDSVIKHIMTEGRTIAGDFSRKPGPKLQKVDSASPYFNVMLRTSQTINQRFLRGDPYVVAAGVFGNIVPAVISAYIMTNGSKALYDWYFRDMPEFEREQYTHFLNIGTIWDWMTGKKQMKDLTPDDFTKQLRVPEFRPLTSAVVHGLRASGLMGRSNPDTLNPDPVNPGNMSSMMSAIAESMAQAFVPIAPPGLQALAKWGGSNIDVGNLYKGGSPIAANLFSSNARGGGGFSVPMNISSTVSKTTGDVIGALAGVFGGQLLQAYDTGVYDLKHPVDKNEGIAKQVGRAIYGGVREIIDSGSIPRTDSFIPLFPKAAERIYKQSPSIKYNFDMRRAIGVVVGREAKGKTGIPELDLIGKDLASFTKNNSAYKQTSKMYKELKDKLDYVDANKSVPYSDRLDQRNQILKQMNANTQTQNALLYRREAELASGPHGEAFQQRFGKPFSFKDFTYEYQNAAHRKKAP